MMADRSLPAPSGAGVFHANSTGAAAQLSHGKGLQRRHAYCRRSVSPEIIQQRMRRGFPGHSEEDG